mmetsp:Transcript_11228/g.26153  ORF Transcript_11228/g.26153 Transcript_11228/m.26153 type:complete len:206 (-) Transcript_11228:17-634(-)
MRATTEVVDHVVSEARELSQQTNSAGQASTLDAALSLLLDNAEMCREIGRMHQRSETCIEDEVLATEREVLHSPGLASPDKSGNHSAGSSPDKAVAAYVARLQTQCSSVRSDLEDEVERRAAENKVREFLTVKLKTMERHCRKLASEKEDAVAKARADGLLKRQLAQRLAAAEAEVARLRAAQPNLPITGTPSSTRRSVRRSLPL